MEITYTRQGDYLLPNLTLPEQDNRPIGLWGQQHLRYIKRSRPILYTNLLTKCRLNEYLADIDEQAQKMYNELVQALLKCICVIQKMLKEIRHMQLITIDGRLAALPIYKIIKYIYK